MRAEIGVKKNLELFRSSHGNAKIVGILIQFQKVVNHYKGILSHIKNYTSPYTKNIE